MKLFRRFFSLNSIFAVVNCMQSNDGQEVLQLASEKEKFLSDYGTFMIILLNKYVRLRNFYADNFLETINHSELVTGFLKLDTSLIDLLNAWMKEKNPSGRELVENISDNASHLSSDLTREYDWENYKKIYSHAKHKHQFPSLQVLRGLAINWLYIEDKSFIRSLVAAPSVVPSATLQGCLKWFASNSSNRPIDRVTIPFSAECVEIDVYVKMGVDLLSPQDKEKLEKAWLGSEEFSNKFKGVVKWDFIGLRMFLIFLLDSSKDNAILSEVLLGAPREVEAGVSGDTSLKLEDADLSGLFVRYRKFFFALSLVVIGIVIAIVLVFKKPKTKQESMLSEKNGLGKLAV